MFGTYIFCLTKKEEMKGFKAIGLNGQSITNVNFKEIMALIHPYMPDALQDEDTEKIIDWAMIHHRVVEEAWRAFGTLIPLRFGSIIHGENETESIKNVITWMEDIYDHIQERYKDLKDKAEYGIQVFWPNDGLMKKVLQKNAQIKDMEKKIATASGKTAYMYKDKQKSLLQRCIAKEIVQASRFLLDRVRPYLNDFQIEQITGGENDRRMLLNISCLLSEDQIENIKEALKEIQGKDGYMPQLSGPWPPYSFARLDDKLYPSRGRIFQVQPGGKVRCA